MAEKPGSGLESGLGQAKEGGVLEFGKVLMKPDWVEETFPWTVEIDRLRRAKQMEEARDLDKVRAYLEDRDESESSSLSSVCPPADARACFASTTSFPSAYVLPDAYYTSGGGKSAGPLFPPSHVSSSASIREFALTDAERPFDPSDARHVLRLKHQTARCLTLDRVESSATSFFGTDAYDDDDDDGDDATGSHIFGSSISDFCCESEESDSPRLSRSDVELGKARRIEVEGQGQVFVGCFCRRVERGSSELIQCTCCRTLHHVA